MKICLTRVSCSDLASKVSAFQALWVRSPFIHHIYGLDVSTTLKSPFIAIALGSTLTN